MLTVSLNLFIFTSTTQPLIFGIFLKKPINFAPIFLLKTGLNTGARIYRSSFGHENDRFRENKAKTLVFSHRKRAFWACFRENWVYNFGHCTQRRGFRLFWMRLDWWVVFEYWNCVEDEISLFSCPKSGHIRW
jgi:hypothetical protein